MCVFELIYETIRRRRNNGKDAEQTDTARPERTVEDNDIQPARNKKLL